MPEQFHAKDLVGNSNRRSHPRQQVRSLSYIDLGDGNGGIVLNLGEGGLALQAVTSLMEDQLPRLRFQLSEARSWLETSGRVTWTSESRKVAGVEFVNLSDTARKQIREWVSSGDSPIESQASEVAAPVAEKIPSAADSLLFMPVAGRPIGIAPPRENSQAAFNSPTTFTDAPSAASVQPVPQPNLKSSWTLKQSQPAEPRYGLVALFGILAAVSLIVGWAAGHAGLARIFKRTNVESASRSLSATSTAAPTVASEPKASGIEIQGTDNRSRLIPFDGPLPPDAATQHGTGQRPASGKKLFQVWVPSPPVRPQDASGNAANEIPPVLTNVPANSTNVLPSPGELGSRSSISTPPPPPQQAPARVGDLQKGRLIRRVEPLYPAIALGSSVEGTVKLHAVIGVDGAIKTLESVSGPDLLIDPAMNAVRQWRYTPTLLDGKPIETDQDIFIVFRLPAK